MVRASLFFFSDTPRKCLERDSLRSKRFQSSYCAKVRAEAKKVIHFFFAPCSSFLDEPREETLATQAMNEIAWEDAVQGLGMAMSTVASNKTDRELLRGVVVYRQRVL